MPLKKEDFLERLAALILEYDDSTKEMMEVFVKLSEVKGVKIVGSEVFSWSKNGGFDSDSEIVIEERDELVDKFLRMLQKGE